MYKIFFNTTEILITGNGELNSGKCDILLSINDLKSNFDYHTKTWRQLTKKTICLPHTTAQEGFKEFSSLFKNIEAAGGLVINPHNEILVIKRNGIWDLPKGKKEKGEDNKTTALREVKEETGIKELKANGLFDITYHIYDTYGEWTLKTTYWFLMTTKATEFIPQREEGIEEIKYITRTELNNLKNNMYPLVYELIMKFFNSER